MAIEGTPRRYLASPSFLETKRVRYDDRVRILGPLDPLLWDRNLVRHIFDFEYVWEVYKPAAQRRWGYYVCPLLHRGMLVGRFEGRFREGRLEVLNLWKERGRRFEMRAYKTALERHEAALNVRAPLPET